MVYNQRMRFFAFLLLFFLLPPAAMAAGALSGDEIRLDDGRTVRLLGIKASGDAAQAFLQSLIEHKSLLLESSGADRYGRVAADVYVQQDKAGKIWLQGELLHAGLAFVYPPTGAEPHLGDLLKLEREARQAGRGQWGETALADLPASNPGKIRYGRFAFVRGKVVKAERIKNMVYLNFGDDWRSDFTVAIAAHDLRLFSKEGIDPLAYGGKTIRARGWVKRNFGPMITVTHPAQIEVLSEAAAMP
jgi:micrococcal nuclease